MKDRMDAEKGLTLSRVCIDNNISNDNEWIHELLKLMLLSKGKGILCCGLLGVRNGDISRDPNVFRNNFTTFSGNIICLAVSTFCLFNV